MPGNKEEVIEKVFSKFWGKLRARGIYTKAT
jgi:hypothetical protein